MPDYGLVCPFLDESPAFCAGVEFGMLFMRMKAATVIDEYVHRENQDQVLLLASRAGWEVLRMKNWDECWVRIKMRRQAKGADG